MPVFEMKAREFKKMRSPVDRKSANAKYVCYLQACSIPLE